METNCINYYHCRKPVEQCKKNCNCYNKTCWDCSQRIGEECGIDGHEVYEDSVPCDNFSSEGRCNCSGFPHEKTCPQYKSSDQMLRR